jgi:hypothetical protein
MRVFIVLVALFVWLGLSFDAEAACGGIEDNDKYYACRNLERKVLEAERQWTEDAIESGLIADLTGEFGDDPLVGELEAELEADLEARR